MVVSEERSLSGMNGACLSNGARRQGGHCVRWSASRGASSLNSSRWAVLSSLGSKEDGLC